MIFFLILIFIVIIIIEVPQLVKQKYWPELVVYTILMTLAFVLTAFQVLGYKIPNPIKLMAYLVKDVLRLDYK